MNKKERISDNTFHMTLIICTYLIVDVILLFCLCLLEVNGVSHNTVLIASIVIEIFATLYVVIRGNLRSAIILYILFLVSPAFLNVIAMSMIFFSKGNEIPFTPTILLLFRTGYTIKGELINEGLRMLLSFRAPALFTIICSFICVALKSGRSKKKEVKEIKTIPNQNQNTNNNSNKKKKKKKNKTNNEKK